MQVLVSGALVILAVVVSAALAGAAGLCLRIYQSRPRLNGVCRVPGIGAPVNIERDAAGIPTVSAANRADVAFGLGFLHAQERYFQMDVARRAAAGELSELLGKAFVTADKKTRPHQFRKRAARLCAGLGADEKHLLSSYTAGVRAGLSTLRARPLEYLVLRSRPQEWRPEDTLLVVFNLYRLLQDERADQAFNRHLLYTALPQSVADFLSPEGSPDWDAPLIGPVSSAPRLPNSELLDFRRHRPKRVPSLRLRPSPFAGSNAWAVAGQHTRHGKAIVANDLHLPFEMPPMFYRATLDVGARDSRLSGITMPGFPFLLAGTNGQIAWGLANAAVAAVDLIRLDREGCPPDAYRTADGVEPLDTELESIRVQGSADAELTIQGTAWGPVTRKTRDGTLFAQSWLAYDPGAVNLAWRELETATCVSEALDAANRIRSPTLAIVVGDCHGDVGWTYAGALPRRSAGAGRLPACSSQLNSEPRASAAALGYPRLQSPHVSRVWAANARCVAGGAFAELVAGGYHACGARATQIRNSLLELELADEAAMLRIQRDDRALFLARWHALFLEALRDRRVLSHPRCAEARTALTTWNGRATADSVAYGLLRRFRDAAEGLVFEPFVALVRARHGQFDLAAVTDQLETPLWQLLSERPMHLLPPWFGDWDELSSSAALQALDRVAAGTPLRAFAWGASNRLAMRHGLSPLLPLIGHLLDAPRSELDGDLNMPLSQTSRHGPVVRFVISPGRSHSAIAQMAGGQTGNRAAPYYLAGHREWLEGTPTPLEPGATRYTLRLEPA